MPIYKLTLLERKEIAKGTVVFVFSKPDNFTYIPGQHGGFTLLSLLKTNPAGSTRRFSLLSAPQDEHIAIATRIQSSEYKRVLNELALGSEVKFTGPAGVFTLHETESTPAVFIAGGIGITPFHSMIRHVLHHQKSPQKMYLFYGNQTSEESAFLKEFFTLQSQYPQFIFVPTMVAKNPDWQGETGFITNSMIKKYVDNLSLPFFYICGSPMMVKALQETLIEMDIPIEKIKVEDFPGY
jgi:ferredoxin-NADP reductase